MIQTALKSPHKEIYKEIPGKVWNSNLYEIHGWHDADGNYVNRYEDGDFILHCAGMPNNLRMKILREYALRAV